MGGDMLQASALANSLIILAIGTVIGIVGYFLKDVKASFRKEQDRQDKEIEKTREELNAFKANLPHYYVMRDDFLRAVTGLEMKVDVISRDIGELNKNVAKLLGGENHE